MLKSCIRPCEVPTGCRHSLVTKSSNFRHLVALQNPQQRVRYKSSRVPKGRTVKQQQSLKPTSPSSSSTPRSVAPETQEEILQHLQEHKTEPPQPLADEAQEQTLKGSCVVKPETKPASRFYTTPRNSHEEGAQYRPLILKPVKSIPNQDLSSTRPAELATPELPRNPGFNYFYKLGKAYLSFYKTGLWNVWSNRKEYNEIRARLGNCTLEDAALYGGQLRNEHGKDRIPKITRREYQLCLRTRHDLGKLIPFGSVFAICGEFTPLVITFLPTSLVPFTVRIPKQVQHDRKWFMKRLESTSLDAFFKQLEEPGEMTPALGNMLAFLHGVSPVAKLPPVIGQLFYRFWVQPRLIRRGLEILADTALIRREGGFGVLEPSEVFEYANKFFCPPLIWRSKIQLQTSGKIDWDSKTAATLASELEEHANCVLQHEWEQFPDQLRFTAGLICEADSLAFVQHKEKEYGRTDKAPC